MSRRTGFLVRKAVVYARFEDQGDGPELGEAVYGCNGVDRTAAVAVFATRAEAEAAARRLDAEERERLNPWWFRGCASRLFEFPPSTGPTLAELGVTIPDPEVVDSSYGPYTLTANQSRWYDEQSPDWPPEVRAAVWREVVGDRGFYDVAEVAVED